MKSIVKIGVGLDALAVSVVTYSLLDGGSVPFALLALGSARVSIVLLIAADKVTQ